MYIILLCCTTNIGLVFWGQLLNNSFVSSVIRLNIGVTKAAKVVNELKVFLGLIFFLEQGFPWELFLGAGFHNMFNHTHTITCKMISMIMVSMRHLPERVHTQALV